MSAIWTLLAGTLLALAGWRWSLRGIDGASRVALVAVLGATAAAFNVVVPVPSIEVTTTVVLATSIVLGAPTGMAVALVTVVGSSLGGGVGAWTTWQLVAGALVAVAGSAVGRLGGREVDWHHGPRLVLLAALAAVSALAWDLVVTAGSLASYAPTGGSVLDQLAAAMLLGAAFTAVHVVCSTAVALVGAPPLLFALQRARPRLDGGTIAPARPATSPAGSPSPHVVR